jgi:hypothetical protein
LKDQGFCGFCRGLVQQRCAVGIKYQAYVAFFNNTGQIPELHVVIAACSHTVEEKLSIIYHTDTAFRDLQDILYHLNFGQYLRG